MKLDQEFLSQLSILYVEDEEVVREQFLKVFSKLFKNVFIAYDGNEGLEKFKEYQDQISIVISDINMPKLNGLEFLKKAKEIDPQIPFIFTTGQTESHYLIEAINNGVTHYAVKPIEMPSLMAQIQDICSEKESLNQLIKTQKSNQTYLDIINKVALVSQTDPHGTITFVNDIFCEISGYSKDELIGVNHRIVRHPSMPTEFFDTLWNSLRAGKVWHGKIRNLAKDGSSYYVDAHIFPMYDAKEDMKGWMAVRFLITEAEEEKQKFYKSVIANVKTSKQTEAQLRKRVLELESKQQIADNIDLIKEEIVLERQRSRSAKKQLTFTEDQNKELREQLDNVVAMGNTKSRNLGNQLDKAKSYIIKQHNAIKDLKKRYDLDTESLPELQQENLRLKNKVAELMDLVKKQ